MRNGMHKQTRATRIRAKVKEAVWLRDHQRCIICGNHNASPNAHYIPRSRGGLGIEQNIITLCAVCHRLYDQSEMRPAIGAQIWDYLTFHYPGLTRDRLGYHKGGNNA